MMFIISVGSPALTIVGPVEELMETRDRLQLAWFLMYGIFESSFLDRFQILQ